jgi:serine/threonine-protein kinase
MSLDEIVEREVQRLLAAGEHAAAAAALRHAGAPARAARLYEQIFEPAAALAAWEAAGDVVAAVRVALTLPDDGSLDRLVGDAIARGMGDALLPVLSKAGRHREVGRLWRARGEPAAAARALEDAGSLAEAAACHEELGDARQAGLLLERWLDLHPDDEDAAVRLGRILARFGRHDDAIALLQRAIRTAGSGDARGPDAAAGGHDRIVCRASPTLALAFSALGYDEAARACLVRWRKAHARLVARAASDDDRAALGADAPPASLDELLTSARAAAFAAVQTSTSPRPADGEHAASPAGSSFSMPDGDDGSDAPLDQQLLLNGRYLLGAPLGGGGIGQVFRAHDAFADRPVAVKILGAAVLASESVQAWAREVRAASALGHPAFVRLVELNLAQGFVVTDLHGEGDGAVLLEQRLQLGGPGAWLLPALQQALDALAAAHRTGLVHGGLKPQNIFVLAGGVKLLDVGAHRLLALRATETGGLASAWPYLSPEQLLGAPADVDGDLYALAAIAYRALTGRPPHAGPTADRSAAPTAVDVVNPEASSSWSAFLQRALSPDRRVRFASAEEMRAVLPPMAPASLPAAARVDDGVVSPGSSVATTTSTTATITAERERYVKQGLITRFGDDDHVVKVFAGRDAVLGRAVFLLLADQPSTGVLHPYVAAARLWRGVQPVYDVLFDDDGRVHMVVLAGDEHHGRRDGRADLATLRAVPQGLARDLCAVADAITALHDAGVAIGGFDVDRAQGPIGPRLTLAPAPLLLQATPGRIDADAASFARLVEVAFGVADDPDLDKRTRLLATLVDGRFLERSDVSALASTAHEPWVRFLPLLTERLVAAASTRVVARLVRTVINER